MFDETIVDKIRQDAISRFPSESCGIIVESGYIPFDNVADDPLKDFKINTEEISEYIINNTLQAIVHSHPHEVIKERSCPSKNDMMGQINTNVPWGIVDTDGIDCSPPYWWGDFILDEPLIGVQFHAGINDCYSIIRKWYWQKRKILLPEFARNDKWWEDDEDMYVENFEKADFYKIGMDELQNGDVVLGRVMSSKINHGGIYLNNDDDGKGVILHHLPNRLSRREAINPWLNKVEICLRHKDA